MRQKKEEEAGGGRQKKNPIVTYKIIVGTFGCKFGGGGERCTKTQTSKER